jgi:predicted transposase YdaD
MKESSTYQAILEEGREEGRGEGEVREARKVLRLQGDSVFGKPDAATIARIDALGLPELENLLSRLPTVTSWEELFAPPALRRGKRRGSP